MNTSEYPQETVRDNFDQEFTIPDEYRTIESIRLNRRKPKDLVPGLFFESSVGLIIAPPYAGKSLLMFDLGIALATQQTWLKWVPVRQVRSLIFALDSPGWEAMEQVDCLVAGRSIYPQFPWPFSLVTREDAERMRPLTPTGQLDYTQPLLGPFNIMDPRWFAHIVQVAHAMDVRFIGLDSFSKIHQYDENDRKQMEAVMKQVAKLASITRSHVMMLHHTPVLDRGAGIYAGRGSSVIAASVDFEATLTRVATNEVRFIIHKGRGSDEDADFHITRVKIPNTSVDRAVQWQVINPEEKIPSRDLAWRYVKNMLSSSAVARSMLLSNCTDQKFAESVDRYLTRFRDFGLVYSPIRGQYALTEKGKQT